MVLHEREFIIESGPSIVAGGYLRNVARSPPFMGRYSPLGVSKCFLCNSTPSPRIWGDVIFSTFSSSPSSSFLFFLKNKKEKEKRFESNEAGVSTPTDRSQKYYLFRSLSKLSGSGYFVARTRSTGQRNMHNWLELVVVDDVVLQKKEIPEASQNIDLQY